MITRKQRIIATVSLLLFATVAAAQFFGIPRRVFSFIVTNTLEVEGASDLQGNVSDSLGNLILADAVDITGNFDMQGVMSDSTGNVTITDDVDITGTLLVNGVAPGNTILKAMKASDTSRNTTTTLADDPDLCVTVVSGTDYIVQMHLLPFSTSTTPEFKFDLGGQTSDSWYSTAIIATNTTATGKITLDTATQTIINLAASGNTGVTWDGMFRASSSGSLCVQWAQNISSATNTTLRASSWMMFTAI